MQTLAQFPLFDLCISTCEHNTSHSILFAEVLLAAAQVEFYFSDSNAPRDAFLLEKIKAHPEVRLLSDI